MKRSLITCLLSLCAALPAVAQVQSVIVNKNIQYQQTSATDVHVTPVAAGQTSDLPWGFSADVNGSNIAGITPPRVTGPINTPSGFFTNGGALNYSTGDKGWRIGPNATDWSSPSLADLNAKWGDGTYTFTVNGASVALNLTGAAFPNPPRLILSGGHWEGDEYVVDPSDDLVIKTNAYTGYGTHVDDRISIVVAGGNYTLPFDSVAPFGCQWFPLGACQYHSSSSGGNTLTYTVRGNTLQPATRYIMGAGFMAIVDSKPNAALPGSTNYATYDNFVLAKLRTTTPVFPMTVTTNINTSTATVTANFQPKPEDAGKQENVYVFAVAPVSLVKGAILKEAGGLTWNAKGSTKDGAGSCALAQMNSSGQLQGVSASNLQPAVSGVLSAQGQSVSVLNNVATPQVAGATFYVGYGTSASAMIATGVNRAAATIPGSVLCQPQPPQTGWWWNPAEGGRGYSIEVQGNHVFFAAFHYDVSGRATWNVASGNVSIDGSLFTGDFLGISGGQTLGGPYTGFPRVSTVGPISLSFSDAAHGTMVWPGGTVAIERQPLVPGGLEAEPQANLPENGWWWNPNESGRGFFIEWQKGYADAAGYMYDDAGNPVWYIAVYTTPNPASFAGNWWQYANGQSMGGAYKPATQISDHVAPVTITFSAPDAAVMTLPNGRTTNLVRQRF
jgi:hypothetical protein